MGLGNQMAVRDPRRAWLIGACLLLRRAGRQNDDTVRLALEERAMALAWAATQYAYASGPLPGRP